MCLHSAVCIIFSSLLSLLYYLKRGKISWLFMWDLKDERYRATVRWTVVTASDQATAVARIKSHRVYQTGIG